MTDLKLYGIRNSAGQWFTNGGWTSEIQDAKLYAKIAQARGRVSFFANLRPDLPTPELVEFDVTESCVVDESERVAKVKRRKLEQTEQRALRVAKWQREEAERQIAKATATLEKLGKS